MRIRANAKRQLVVEQRKATKDKRSVESKQRKEKRKAKSRAQEAANAVECSPAGRKAAEALKVKRGKAQKKEQADYKKAMSRDAARMGGRRKHIHEEFQAKVEE